VSLFTSLMVPEVQIFGDYFKSFPNCFVSANADVTYVDIGIFFSCSSSFDSFKPSSCLMISTDRSERVGVEAGRL